MITLDSAIAIAQSFVIDCKLNGLQFKKVLLFGSLVDGTLHEWSDIDLLLVSDQFGDNIFENLKLYSKVNIKYPIIEVHPYPTANYIEGDDFILSISKKSIEII